MAKASVLQLHVSLVDSSPPIWRRLLVSDQTTLADLHDIMQIAMGWQNSHLHAFEIGGDRYSDPDPMPLEDTRDSTRVKLADFAFAVNDKFSYTYDFGDGWLHKIKVEKILPPEPDQVLPVCIKGKRACPPEDCGGVWGYEELLERMNDPEDPEYEELMEWIGYDFEPEAFAIGPINQQLQAS